MVGEAAAASDRQSQRVHCCKQPCRDCAADTRLAWTGNDSLPLDTEPASIWCDSPVLHSRYTRSGHTCKQIAAEISCVQHQPQDMIIIHISLNHVTNNLHCTVMLKLLDGALCENNGWAPDTRQNFYTTDDKHYFISQVLICYASTKQSADTRTESSATYILTYH